MILASNKLPTHVHRIVAGIALVYAALWGESVPADETVGVKPQTTQTTFFSDDDVSYKLDLTSAQAIDGVVSWQLTTRHRTHGRGDVEVKIDPAKPGTATFRLRMPHIKEGVIEKTLLTASFKAAGDAEPVTIHERDLWVFSSDPFVDRKQWLEQLELQLYDPGGETAKIFEAAEIPFKNVRSAAALSAIEAGIVVVGEGVSLRKNAALAETLLSLAAGGRSVLWFGPDDGDFDLPGGGQVERKRPKKLLLGGSNMIEQLDKRLDPNLWADAEKAKSIGLQIVARRNRTYIEIVEPDQGWSWLQMEFGDPDGQMILCGLRLVDCWDASPTPRFMLARLLEQLDDTDQPTELTNQ